MLSTASLVKDMVPPLEIKDFQRKNGAATVPNVPRFKARQRVNVLINTSKLNVSVVKNAFELNKKIQKI